MPSIDVKKERIDAKIVYYGPGRCGKTTSLKYLAQNLEPECRGRLTSRPTKHNPDLYVDMLPVRMGDILGFQTTFNLCSGPGLASVTKTRRLLLRDTDGIVFVADSRPGRREANVDSLKELNENLAAVGIQMSDVPHVIQYNRFNESTDTAVEDLRADVNVYGVPEFIANARTGQGVLTALQAIVRSVSQDLQRRL